MNKNEALEKGLEDAKARSKSESEKEQERLQLRKDAAKPALLKRIGAGLLDFLFAGVLAGLLFLFSYFVIFPSLGYQEESAKIVAVYEDSGLYVFGEGKYEPLTDHYDSNKTPEENYDVPITHYYSTNARAIADHKLEKYQQAKLNSELFVLDAENNVVRKEGVSDEYIKNYLEVRFDEATTYLFADPEVIDAFIITRNIMLFSILIIVVISSSIFYFVVPLLNKDGCTFGYLICRLVPVSSIDTLPQQKSKLMLRALIFVTISYLSPIGLFVLADAITFSFIPFFVNTIILSFSHSNSGLHDYGTKTLIINRSRTNAMEILKQIKGEYDE